MKWVRRSCCSLFIVAGALRTELMAANAETTTESIFWFCSFLSMLFIAAFILFRGTE